MTAPKIAVYEPSLSKREADGKASALHRGIIEARLNDLPMYEKTRASPLVFPRVEGMLAIPLLFKKMWQT